jgi:hypothetical protein
VARVDDRTGSVRPKVARFEARLRARVEAPALVGVGLDTRPVNRRIVTDALPQASGAEAS